MEHDGRAVSSPSTRHSHTDFGLVEEAAHMRSSHHADPLIVSDALKACDRLVPLIDRILLMGILNVTPDSFSDGGRFLDPEAAVAQACALAEQGADFIDIGAESTRPGSEPVDEQEEIRRLIPVVKAVSRRIQVPISVDTTKARVARLALEAGASIINDVSALRADAGMGPLVAEAGAGVVLMHMQGQPRTMQESPVYGDVVAEVRQFLKERVQSARAFGIARAQILLDPGIGFGKNLEHNLTLLARLSELDALGYPMLVGVSRKGFLGQLLGREVGERLMGTAGAVAMAVAGGARVIRVHDIAQIRDVVTVVEAIRRSRPSPSLRSNEETGSSL
jgi:dihydropteroate synthase